MTTNIQQSNSLNESAGSLEHYQESCDGSGPGSCAGVEESRRNNEERLTLARTENKVVSWMRVLVVAVLVTASCLIATGVFVLTRRDQRHDFQAAFVADATKLLEAFRLSVDRQLETIDSLSVSITSHAINTGAIFPNVTLPDFAIRFASTRILARSFMINYNPLVTDETRAGWEAYQIENRGHALKANEIETSLRQRQDAEYNSSSHHDADHGRALAFTWPEHADTIVQLGANGSQVVAPLGSGPYLPLWMLSPALPTRALLNFDSKTHPAFGGAQMEVVKTGQAVFDITTNLVGQRLENTRDYFSLLIALGQFRNEVDEYQGDPASSFAYPVFDSFDLDNRKVAGTVGSNVYWRLFFKDVLGPDTPKITCVLENSRGQTFSYAVTGKDVTYLGIDDQHDRDYGGMEQAVDILLDSDSEKCPLESKSYMSVHLNHEYCNYKLRIFPTREYEKQHVTAYPYVATAVVLCVFTLTSLVFVLFSIAVNRRQRVVMDRAVASSAIVSSLFPSQVRDQIYQETEINTSSKHFSIRTATEDTKESEYQYSSPVGKRSSIRPIADVFDATTIMFADMVGFTKWSAKRDPVQVFELLETLYKAFDAIAVRRKVFKVETIGDCYVAVAGLPDPQEDHAVIMVKFADACMFKMKELTTELAHSLGADTADLTMRVGLHSGPVTGGVLRGQKSRFQLFGDTMNTASRMESTGAAGRIHVSEEAARELEAKGKSNWITRRTDTVTAKGKGEMQTFWVSPRTTADECPLTVVAAPRKRKQRIALPPRECDLFEL